jgi:hypothetical protein
VRSSNHNDHDIITDHNDIITDHNDIVADEHKHRDWIWDHSRSEHCSIMLISGISMHI